MCGRYTFRAKPAAVAEEFDPSEAPRHCIRPLETKGWMPGPEP
jgi:hypothetical protein